MGGAAPPRASPSILVRITPVTPSASSNPCAMRTASWPVIPSATKRISSGRMASFRRCSSRIISWSICSRPAVDVGGDEARRPVLALELAGELSGRGRLPRPLEPDHHHDRGRDGAELETAPLLAEHGGELVVD